jgi:hypothetical protein
MKEIRYEKKDVDLKLVMMINAAVVTGGLLVLVLTGIWAFTRQAEPGSEKARMELPSDAQFSAEEKPGSLAPAVECRR